MQVAPTNHSVYPATLALIKRKRHQKFVMSIVLTMIIGSRMVSARRNQENIREHFALHLAVENFVTRLPTDPVYVVITRSDNDGIARHQRRHANRACATFRLQTSSRLLPDILQRVDVAAQVGDINHVVDHRRRAPYPIVRRVLRDDTAIRA